MDMILLDWTRMGRSYCLAGAVLEKGDWRIVRPLPMKHRAAPVRNVGWSPFLFDGHARWEIFELIGAETATPEPPHLEDLWVHGMRSRHSLASPEQRLTILRATLAGRDRSLFGAPLRSTQALAYLEPGEGLRSLTTVVVRSEQISFGVYRVANKEP
ncbi:MAG TPA: hypothetical protein VKI65_13020, partial [Gemmataceae bacterium]|nr:hypothetical protein [Gemmataceae bacterium]